MPYFVSIPDSVVAAENLTRLNTNMEPYTDTFAINQILRNREGLLASNLMRNNLELKAAYVECLDHGLFALSTHESVDTKGDERLVVLGRMTPSSTPWKQRLS